MLRILESRGMNKEAYNPHSDIRKFDKLLHKRTRSRWSAG